MVVIPAWLDQVATLNYAPEKTLLTQIETWAEENGWVVSDGSSLPLELRQRTDVLLVQPNKEQKVRMAVLHKSRRGEGVIRLDASNLRTVELVYRLRQQRWRVEAGSIPIEEDVLSRGWDWLFDLMFRP